jgi:Transcriptional regulatory protein, C terminal
VHRPFGIFERRGDIVTREELRQQLWATDTFVDFDHSLNAAVKGLRDALGESADSPVFIETLARRGYHFTVALSNGPFLLRPASFWTNKYTGTTNVWFLANF